jgi:hypothetical protein
MKAYTVWYIWKETRTNTLMAEFSFALPGKTEIQKQRIFDREEDLHRYLSGDKLTWFRVCVEAYILESPLMAHNEPPTAMLECREYYNKMCENTFSLKKICNSFLVRIEHFTALLPAAGTPKHEEMQNDLRELIIFCEQETKETTQHTAAA